MASAIYFFAASDDDLALIDKARSLGLRLVPGEFRTDLIANLGRPEHSPLCYLSTVDESQLHPHGPNRDRVGWATDPMIEFIRSYRVGDVLVAGRLWWSDSPPAFAQMTKPPFQALKKWISGSWSRRERDGYYIAPGARLASEQGLRLEYLPPDVNITSS